MGFECYDGGMSFERDVEGDFKVQNLLCQPSINHELLIAQAETLLKKNAIYRKLEDLISRDTWKDERSKPQTHTDNETSQERQTTMQEEALRLEEEMELKGRERDAVVNSLRFLGVFYNLPPQVFSSATYLFDSLTHQLKILPKFFNTMHLSCLHISLHMCYQAHLVPLDEAIRLTQADPILVQSTTSFIVSNFQCSDLPTPLSYLHLFLQLISIEDPLAGSQCGTEVNQLLELVLCHHSFTKYRLDILVLSCCQQVLSNKSQLDKYNKVVKEIQYFCQMPTDELDSCMRDIQVFKHHYYNHHHAYNNNNHKNFNTSDDLSLINKNQAIYNNNNNNNTEPNTQSPATLPTKAVSSGAFVAPLVPQAPQCKLVWTVSKKLLSKMRPSSRAPNCLEALTEEEEEEEDDDDDDGLVMIKSDNLSLDDGECVVGDGDADKDDVRANVDVTKVQNELNDVEASQKNVGEGGDVEATLIQGVSGDDEGYNRNVVDISNEKNDAMAGPDGDEDAFKCFETTGHFKGQHESFISDDNDANNRNNNKNNHNNKNNNQNAGGVEADEINGETYKITKSKASAHPCFDSQSDFIIKCLLFLDFENLDNNDAMENKRFKKERYIHDRWMEERIKRKISKMNKMKFNDSIKKESNEGMNKDKGVWADDVMVVMFDYGDNEDEKMKKKKKKRKRKNKHKK